MTANEKRIRSFEPASDENSHTLILGSVPGIQSLNQAQYYAHPQNMFWRIMAELANTAVPSDYAGRLQLLKHNGIALWDVLHSCVRAGSLDTAIESDSIQPNDFKHFFRQHPRIRRIFFNGSYAESVYRKHVLPTLNTDHKNIPALRLPSTSPAHASLRFQEKLESWRAVLPDTDQ